MEPEEEHSRRQPSLDRSSGRTAITVPGEIEDEDESPLDLDDSSIAASSESRAGWVNVTSKRGRRAQASTEGPLSQQQQLALSATGKQALDFASKPRNQQPTRAQFARKVNVSMAKAAKMPNFAPRDEIKVVVRPRGGLMVGKTKPMELMSAIIRAAGIEISAAAEDTTSLNVTQNIMVVSTPDEERAKRYERVRAIAMGDQIFEAFAYRAATNNNGSNSNHNHNHNRNRASRALRLPRSKSGGSHGTTRRRSRRSAGHGRGRWRRVYHHEEISRMDPRLAHMLEARRARLAEKFCNDWESTLPWDRYGRTRSSH